jgi:hypothetical protein
MGNNSKTRRSGDPRVRQQDSHHEPAPAPVTPTAATPAEAWVGVDEKAVAVLMLPSGNAARVRRSGPEAFMTSGIIPDPLTAIVEKGIRSKKGLPPQKQADIAKDPEKLGAVIEMLDRTLVYAVVEPTVVMPPACVVCDELDTTSAKQHSDKNRDDYHEYKEGDRVAGVVYADRVSMDDKMFIMTWTLGGTSDLERFREEQRRSVASISTQ